MDLVVFIAVIAAAMMHAGWNAAIKLGLDPLVSLTLIVMMAGLFALPGVAITGLPGSAALPAVLASAVLHLVYNLALVEAYRTGGLGFVYPVARGSAPMIVTIVSSVVFGDVLAPGAYLGILCLTMGIATLSLAGGVRAFLANRRAFGFAAITACAIAAYSMVDAHGARVSGNAAGYSMVLFFADMVSMPAILAWRQGRDGFRAMRPALARGAIGGLLQLIGYTIIIVAFTHAPVAMVAALRETSVLFAALLAVVLLREPFGPIRAVATVLVCAGAVLIRLG